MDWVLSCTEPKRVCWGPQYTASLVKFPSTSAGSSRPHAGATPVVPRARAGRPGSIVDDGALVQALTARTIAGAALDVFDTEPLPADHPFRSLENVLATPHIGYVAEDLYRTFFGDAAVSIA